MKLRDIIARIDTSKPSEHIDNETISRELDINVPYDADLEEHGFSKYRFVKWVCTDTWVGSTCIFLDGNPICITYQSARKDDERFFWISDDAAMLARERLLKLSLNEPLRITTQSLDCEVPDEGFHVDYGTQLLTDSVIYDGKCAKVVKKYGQRYEAPVENWSKVDLEIDGKVYEKVPLSEIFVPYDILPVTP